MQPEGLEKRVEVLEQWRRRSRMLGTAKTLFYIIVILGVVIYLYDVNRAAEELMIDFGRPEIYPAGFTSVEIRVPLEIYNPSDKIMAKMIYYRVYVNDYYVGDGFQPYLDLPSGWSNHTLQFKIDLTKAGCSLASALSEGGNLTVGLSGYAMVDLYIFGKIPWRTITVAFEENIQGIETPDLGAVSRALELVNAICNMLEGMDRGSGMGSQGVGLPISLP